MEPLRFSSEQKRFYAICRVVDSYNYDGSGGAGACMAKIQALCNADIELDTQQHLHRSDRMDYERRNYFKRQGLLSRLLWRVMGLKSIYNSGYVDGWNAATNYEELVWGVPRSRYKGADQGTLTEAD